MGNTSRPEITDAEVLAVSGGTDEATGQPVVCLTLRPITGSGWGHINYSLAEDNARTLLDRLAWVFEASPSIKDSPAGSGDRDDGPTRP